MANEHTTSDEEPSILMSPLAHRAPERAVSPVDWRWALAPPLPPLAPHSARGVACAPCARGRSGRTPRPCRLWPHTARGAWRARPDLAASGPPLRAGRGVRAVRQRPLGPRAPPVPTLGPHRAWGVACAPWPCRLWPPTARGAWRARPDLAASGPPPCVGRWALAPPLPPLAPHPARGVACHSCDADFEASVLDTWTDVKKDGRSGCLYGPMSEVADGAIVLSHCDVEMTISNYDGMKLDFGYGKVVTVWENGYTARILLDLMIVEPETNVGRLDGNSRYLRRVTDPQAVSQPPCSGTVHLLWLQEDVSLVLTPSRRKEGAYERLGIFHPEISLGILRTYPPKMPKTVQRSKITLV